MHKITPITCKSTNSSVDKNEDLRSLEKGVLLDNFKKISHTRKPDMEFRILQRMTLHQGHVKNLMNSPHVNFIKQNRFPEVLPCKVLILVKHNRVVLKNYQPSSNVSETSSAANEAKTEFLDYINANYINVRYEADSRRSSATRASARSSLRKRPSSALRKSSGR